MFDVLVDQPKKRFYLLMTFFCLFIIGSACFDVVFAIGILCANGFSEMIEVCAMNQNSFFAYFFYTLLSSPALYSNDVLFIVFQMLNAFLISNNFCDWLTILGMVGLGFSHKNKMSKTTFGIQLGYFGLRFIITIFMVLFLYPTLMYNNATLALTRIHIVSYVVVGASSILILLTLIYLINIIKLFYLPLFEKVDD